MACVCIPVKEHRDPLHGNNDRLAVWGLRVRVGRAAGRAGFLLAWGETNMTRRDAHRLCYGRARVNLTSNPCHVWTRRKHRWEDERGVGPVGERLEWVWGHQNHNFVDLKLKIGEVLGANKQVFCRWLVLNALDLSWVHNILD